jgi:hypothetical protein
MPPWRANEQFGGKSGELPSPPYTNESYQRLPEGSIASDREIQTGPC